MKLLDLMLSFHPEEKREGAGLMDLGYLLKQGPLLVHLWPVVSPLWFRSFLPASFTASYFFPVPFPCPLPLFPSSVLFE